MSLPIERNAVSIGRDVTKPWELNKTTIEEVIDYIRTGEDLKGWTAEVRRKIGEKDAYANAKSKLPYFLPNGVFSGRKASGAQSLSGCCVLEVDHVETAKVKEVKALVASDSNTEWAYVTPSGRGVKWGMKWKDAEVSTAEEWKEKVFAPAQGYWTAKGLEIDASGKDISRAAFCAYDPEAYFNSEATAWTPTAEDAVDEMEFAYEPEDTAVALPATGSEQVSESIQRSDDESRMLGWMKERLNAKLGERHSAKLAVGVMLGRCVKGGCVSNPTAVLAELKREALRQGHAESDLHSIEDGLKKGLADAKYEPIKEWGKGSSNASFIVRDGEKTEVVYSAMLAFLEGEGFAIYKKFGMTRDGLVFVRVQDHVIRRVTDTEIRRFLTEHVRENASGKLEGWLHKVGNLTAGIFEQLHAFDPHIHTDDRDRIHFYYSNGVLEIKASGWTLKPYSEIDGYVWEEMIQKRNWQEDFAPGEWGQFLKNIMGGGAGDRLKPFMSGLGYLLSRHKDRATAKAVVLTDEALDSEHGGTGKGIIFQALGKLRLVQSLDFRTRDVDRFLFQGVKPESNILHIEDVDRKFDFGALFNTLTSDFEIENKGQDRVTIPYAESPKLGLSTNFQFKGSSDSHARRKVEYELANHYSAKHTPFDEFHHNLFDDWSVEEWHRFDTLMASAALQFLSEGLMDGHNINTTRKRLETEVGKAFIDYMEDWLRRHELDEVGAWYSTRDFADSYQADSGDKRSSREDIGRRLRKWAALTGWVLTDKRTPNGRGFTLEMGRADRQGA